MNFSSLFWFLVVMLIVFLGFTILHEKAHLDIYNNFGCVNAKIVWLDWNGNSMTTCSLWEKGLSANNDLVMGEFQMRVEFTKYFFSCLWLLVLFVVSFCLSIWSD